MRPRVLLISHAFSEPGLRRQVVALRDYTDIRLVVPERAFTLLWEDFRAPDDESGVMRRYRRLPLFGSQYVLLSATMGIRRFRPEVIHIDYDPWAAVFWQARIAAAVFAPRARVLVGAKKNTYRQYPGWRGRMKHLIARIGLSSVHRVVAASEMAAAMYQDRLGARSEQVSVVTHVGVDVERFSPATDRRVESATVGPTRVGYCGRYSEHKGLDDLIDAVAECRAARGLDVRLALLGAGPMEGRLRGLASKYHWLTVNAAVPSDEVPRFLRQLDVYVLPARILPDHQEHDGHALLQALACGLPTVATRGGIVPEIIGDDLGLLVNPSDPRSLADALELLARDPQLRAELGRRSRRASIARYSLESVAERKAQIYLAERERG
jgi:glycosyltransferase involved in cell wall biosynthesis